MPVFHEYKIETVFEIFLDQLYKEKVDQLLKKPPLIFPKEEQFSRRRWCTRARESKTPIVLLEKTNGLHRSFSQGLKNFTTFYQQTICYLTF